MKTWKILLYELLILTQFPNLLQLHPNGVGQMMVYRASLKFICLYSILLKLEFKNLENKAVGRSKDYEIRNEMIA